MQFSNELLSQILVKNEVTITGIIPPAFTASIDNRVMQKSDFFFFLNTTEHNSYALLDFVVSQQISGIVIDQEHAASLLQKIRIIQNTKNIVVITVSSVSHALYEIASYLRKHASKTIIAIAGTNAARITVQFLSNILSSHGKTVVRIENHGQQTIHTVAQKIINERMTDSIIIFEAISHRRYDMETIADITQPSYAAITTIGTHNVDTIGSPQDVAAEQRAIFSRFTEKNIGVINGDIPSLSFISYPYPIIKFGLKISNQIQARKIRIYNSQIHCILKIYKNKYPVVLHSTHSESIIAALAAIAMAKLLMIPDMTIVSTIQKPFSIRECFEFKPVTRAFEATVIDDTYSVDPESTKSSLTALDKLESRGPKIVILGDMHGLGITSGFWHRQLGRYLRKLSSIAHIIIFGKHGDHIKKTAPKELSIDIAESYQNVEVKLQEYAHRNPLILVKENSMGMKTLIKRLCEK